MRLTSKHIILFLVLLNLSSVIPAYGAVCYPVKEWIPVYLDLNAAEVVPSGDVVSLLFLNRIWTLHPMITTAIGLPNTDYDYVLEIKLGGKWVELNHGVDTFDQGWEYLPVTYNWCFQSITISIDLLDSDFRYTATVRHKDCGVICSPDAEYKLPVRERIEFYISREMGDISLKYKSKTTWKTRLNIYAGGLQSNFVKYKNKLLGKKAKSKSSNKPPKYVYVKTRVKYDIGGNKWTVTYRSKKINPAWLKYRRNGAGVR